MPQWDFNEFRIIAHGTLSQWSRGFLLVIHGTLIENHIKYKKVERVQIYIYMFLTQLQCR
jgi:hypothetical protein